MREFDELIDLGRYERRERSELCVSSAPIEWYLPRFCAHAVSQRERVAEICFSELENPPLSLDEQLEWSVQWTLIQ